MNDFELRELLKKTSYPFLAADEGEWIGSDGEPRTFNEMGNEYVENSYKYLDAHRYNIEHGFFLQGVKYDKSKYEEIVERTKELYEKKLDELRNYLK